MYKGIYLVLGLMVMTGCATTKSSSVQQLSNRLDLLENELRAKDQEISDLKQELQLAKMDYSKKSDYSDSGERRIKSYASTQSFSGGSNLDIIRVEGITSDQVQLALKNAGFYEGPVDGKVGPKTKEAIKAYQGANELKADGIVGRGTWAKLKENL